jgi:hypothetical protein
MQLPSEPVYQGDKKKGQARSREAGFIKGIIKSFCGGSRGAVFTKRVPLAAGGKLLKKVSNYPAPT